MLFKSIAFFIALIVINSQVLATEQVDARFQRDWQEAVEAYKKGDGDNSIPFFMIVAGSGIPEGSHAMGVAFEEGVVIPQNSKMAMKYFICNAETGYWRSQAKLVLLYEEGVQTKKNLQDAYFWSLILTSNLPSNLDPEFKKVFISSRNNLMKRVGAENADNIQRKAQTWKPIDKKCFFGNPKL